MNEATIEVPPEYATEFHRWLGEEVAEAAREAAEYDRAVVQGVCAEDAEGNAYRRRTMIEGAKLLSQAENRRLGEPAEYNGDPRVLSDVLDQLLNGKADELNVLCGIGPVDYGAITQLIEQIQWLTTEAERVDAIDRGAVA
jgi:hypothetical protein